MAIYTNLEAVNNGEHGLFESSLLKSTISGHLWDCLVVEETTSSGTTTRTPISVDNGVAVRIGAFTNNLNGLQERFATIAGVKDKVGIVGSVPLIKDAYNKEQESEIHFFNKAGADSKVYEVVGDEFDGDIFGVSLAQFTTASQTNVKRDNYVVLDGNGQYVAQATGTVPNKANYGFIGKIHSLYTNNFYTIVRIYVVQNKDVN